MSNPTSNNGTGHPNRQKHRDRLVPGAGPGRPPQALKAVAAPGQSKPLRIAAPGRLP